MAISVTVRRVVRSADVPVLSCVGEKLPRLIVLLEDWARWCRALRVDLGYPNRSAGCESGGGVSSSDHVYDAIDVTRMGVVDAAVSDLPPAQCAAVMRRYELAAVYRFRDRYPYEQAIADAHSMLMVSIERKGVPL